MSSVFKSKQASNQMQGRPGTTQEFMHQSQSGKLFSTTIPHKRAGRIKFMHLSPHLQFKVEYMNKNKSPQKQAEKREEQQFCNLEEIGKESEQESNQLKKQPQEDYFYDNNEKIQSDDEEEYRLGGVLFTECNIIKKKKRVDNKIERINSLPEIQVELNHNHNNSNLNTSPFIGYSDSKGIQVLKNNFQATDGVPNVEQLGDTQFVLPHNMMPSSFTHLYYKRMKNSKVIKTPSHLFEKCEGCGQDISIPCICQLQRKISQMKQGQENKWFDQAQQKGHSSQSNKQQHKKEIYEEKSLNLCSSTQNIPFAFDILLKNEETHQQVERGFSRSSTSKDLNERRAAQQQFGYKTSEFFHKRGESQSDYRRVATEQSPLNYNRQPIQLKQRQGNQSSKSQSQTNMSDLIFSQNNINYNNSIQDQQSINNINITIPTSISSARNIHQQNKGVKNISGTELEKNPLCSNSEETQTSNSMTFLEKKPTQNIFNEKQQQQQMQATKNQWISQFSFLKKNPIQDRIQNTKRLHQYFYSGPKQTDLSKIKQQQNSPQRSFQQQFLIQPGIQYTQPTHSRNFNEFSRHIATLKKKECSHKRENSRSSTPPPLGVLQSQTQRDFLNKENGDIQNGIQNVIKYEDIYKQQQERLDLIVVASNIYETYEPNITNKEQKYQKGKLRVARSQDMIKGNFFQQNSRFFNQINHQPLQSQQQQSLLLPKKTESSPERNHSRLQNNRVIISSSQDIKKKMSITIQKQQEK